MIVATLAIFQVWNAVGVYLGWSGAGRCWPLAFNILWPQSCFQAV